MEQAYKIFTKLISIKTEEALDYRPQCLNQPEMLLEKFILGLASSKGFENQSEILTKFINYMTDHRYCKLSSQYFQRKQDIHLLACSENKIYTFDSAEHRAYCIYGKAVSLLRRKGKDSNGERSIVTSQLQSAIFQLYQQNSYPLSKNQSHQIDDILLHFSVPDQDFDPIHLSNEIYSPFVPQPYALILVLSVPPPKPDQLQSFLKQTLLHVYFQQANLLNKVMYRQTFYKNSVLRGIYFIEQGEVISTGGRIVARGWVTNGKCKSTGYGWKFKPLPFFNSMAKNQHIWKQFTNDLVLNQQYPFKIGYLLGLEEQPILQERTNKRGLKLPRIGNISLDYGKLTAIEKVRHYDDRMSDICEYKQKLLTRKVGNSTQPFDNIMGSMGGYQQKQHQRLMLRHQSTSRQMINKSLNSSTQNILIMSVLKKLEGLTEQGVPVEQRIERRDKIRISPALLYQKSRVMKKKRYNQ